MRTGQVALDTLLKRHIEKDHFNTRLFSCLADWLLNSRFMFGMEACVVNNSVPLLIALRSIYSYRFRRPSDSQRLTL